MKGHFTQCHSVPHWCVFNSFWFGSLLVWVFTWNLLTPRKTTLILVILVLKCPSLMYVMMYSHLKVSLLISLLKLVRLGSLLRKCVKFSFFTSAMSLLTCSDQSQRGSLFTLFLYSPLLAFSSVCGLNSVRRGLWERAQEFLRKVYRDIGQMITRSRNIGSTFLDSFILLVCY